MTLKFTMVACLAGAALAAGSAAAAPISDGLGDFLTEYVGPLNPDFDVVSVEAILTGSGRVDLVGTMAGAPGVTAGAAYVWGIDRGMGQEFLTFATPSIGAGITFDAVAILFADATGLVIDLLAGTPPTTLAPDAVEVSGDAISVTLSEALLPSTGFAFADYRYNLWPRFAPGGVDPGNNLQVSDLAPDASTFTASPVPLPAGIVLLAGGLATLGAFRTRRAATRR